MLRSEVLVHVSAPARCQDDGRYYALSENIANFQAAAVTPICAVNPDQQEPASSAREEEFSLQYHAVKHSGGYAPEQASNHAADTEANQLLRSGQPTLSLHLPNINHVRRTSGFTSAINPPYKKPFQVPKTLHLTIVVPQTPELPRPRTAPTAPTAPTSISSTIIVPDSHPAASKRKRALSESSSFNSFLSTVSETPLHHLHTGQADDVKSTDAQNTCRTASKKPCLSQCSAGESQVLGAPQPFFLPDRSLDWTSSAESLSWEVTPSPLASTVSPSQTTKDRFGRQTTSMEQASHSTTNTAQAIHLSTPASSSNGPHAEDYQRALSAVMKSPSALPAAMSAAETIDSSENTDPVDPLYSQILNMRNTIEPPGPTETHSSFRTHLTDALDQIEHRLPVAEFFRPAYVSRDVRVLERGYWSLSIALGSDDAVAARRKLFERKLTPNPYANIITETSPRARFAKWEQIRDGKIEVEIFTMDAVPGTQYLWSKTDFLEFWHALERFVGTGNAGWGVRVVIDSVLDTGAGQLQMHLRISTWGEVLGHIWLLLWVLSDKRVAFEPMEWKDAGEVVVVRMTGDRYKGGKLAAWKRKGPPGEEGGWSLSDDP